MDATPLDAHLLVLPESAGASLYGMLDVLSSTGTVWRELAGLDEGTPLVRPYLVSLTKERFTLSHNIPVQPDLTIAEAGYPKVLIITDLWLAPDDPMADRYADLKAWLRDCRAAGTMIYSVCTGSVLLAAAGLLDGLDVASHWGYEDLFRRNFPDVRFDPAPSMCFSDPQGRLVTAGGASAWQDLALHIISRHVSPGEALHTAKVFLLKMHSEGQLPYTNRVRRLSHADSVVRHAETWLAENYCAADPVAGVVATCGVAERTLKRRFRQATGVTLIAYAQNLRIEAAKRVLETARTPVEDVAAAVGYENVTFFRRLFKRGTGLSPGDYRRMFKPLSADAGPAGN